MENYFYADDNKKIIKEALLTTGAFNWAKKFISPEEPKDKKNKKNPPLTSTQLRKFHIEAKTLEERCKNLDDPGESFKLIKPLVKMLKSKVSYVCPINGRDRKVPMEFRLFIEEMVDNIEDWEDFKAFSLCFEAVVGFFYGQGGRK